MVLADRSGIGHEGPIAVAAGSGREDRFLLQVLTEPVAVARDGSFDPLDTMDRAAIPTEAGEHGAPGGQSPLFVRWVQKGERTPPKGDDHGVHTHSDVLDHSELVGSGREPTPLRMRTPGRAGLTRS